MAPYSPSTPSTSAAAADAPTRTVAIRSGASAILLKCCSKCPHRDWPGATLYAVERGAHGRDGRVVGPACLKRQRHEGKEIILRHREVDRRLHPALRRSKQERANDTDDRGAASCGIDDGRPKAVATEVQFVRLLVDHADAATVRRREVRKDLAGDDGTGSSHRNIPARRCVTRARHAPAAIERETESVLRPADPAGEMSVRRSNRLSVKSASPCPRSLPRRRRRFRLAALKVQDRTADGITAKAILCSLLVHDDDPARLRRIAAAEHSAGDRWDDDLRERRRRKGRDVHHDITRGEHRGFDSERLPAGPAPWRGAGPRRRDDARNDSAARSASWKYCRPRSGRLKRSRASSVARIDSRRCWPTSSGAPHENPSRDRCRYDEHAAARHLRDHKPRAHAAHDH